MNARRDATVRESMPACCSAFYEQDWVRHLAEDSFHPGGAELTRRTVAAMELPADATLLDLGCGTGTTALMLGKETGYRVTGVDASAANIETAARRAAGEPERFFRADAHVLPFDDNEFDGVLAECVFSLLADKRAALAEIRRVLKPGGCLGLTDMAIEKPLPDDITEVVAPWTCLADALDRDTYAARFEAAGFELAEDADESAGLTRLIRNLKRRLLLIGAGGLMAGGALPNVATIKYWLDRFESEVQRGAIAYWRFQLRT